MTTYTRWRGLLAGRRALLAYARRQAAFWRKQKTNARPGTKAYSHAGAMLADREAKVAHRAYQVAYAERVVARNKPGSARAKAVSWARAQVGTTESPAGSNRGGKITTWQNELGAWLVGLAWCGTFCAAALRRAGVKGLTYRMASVAFIEDDARNHAGPFRGWTTDAGSVLPGDLVVLFGRGVHVELVTSVGGGVVHTVGGNTSSGNGGSQANGGGVFARVRPMSDVHGFALVNYPG